MKISGDRRFSHDLDQGGMELPATYTFTSTDADMHKLIKLVGKAVEEYNKVRSENDTKREEEKSHHKEIDIFFLIILYKKIIYAD